MIRVTDLYCYPIKSCAGSRVDSATLTKTGLAHDRLMLITRPDGTFVTQREYPTMALIEPSVEGNLLTLRAPTMSPLSRHVQRVGDTQPVTIWRSTVDAVVQDLAINQWISDFLQADLQLVAMHENAQRTINPKFQRRPDDVVSFADGYATTILSQASLDLLNSKLALPVNAARFRPNIVVAGCSAHAEDDWQSFRLGPVRMSSAKPCERCIIPSIDQQTGIVGKEPTRTLAGYRRSADGVIFGVHLIHDNTGVLTVGDRLDDIELFSRVI